MFVVLAVTVVACISGRELVRNCTARAGGCGSVLYSHSSRRCDRSHRIMTMFQELTVQDSERNGRDEEAGCDSTQDNRDHTPFLEETLEISKDALSNHQGWFAVTVVVDLAVLRRPSCLELDLLEILHLDWL